MSINPNKKKHDLERLMSKYFDEYQSLQLLRSQLNEALKTGYFLMSKSRMSMGLKSLGQLQYPENMKSSVIIKKPLDSESYIDLTKDCYTVQSKEEIEQNKHHHRREQRQEVLVEEDYDSVSPFSQYNGTSTNTSAKKKNEEESSQTRKRTTAATTSSDNNNKESSSNGTSNGNGSGMIKSASMTRIEQLLESATLTESLTSNGNNGKQHEHADHTSDGEYDDYSSDDYSDDDKDKVSQKMVSLTNRVKRQKKKSLKANPIYWFGFLTPTTLKQSQAQFNQAVTLSIEISNKLARMQAIQNRYFEISQMN